MRFISGSCYCFLYGFVASSVFGLRVLVSVVVISANSSRLMDKNLHALDALYSREAVACHLVLLSYMPVVPA